MAGKKFVQSDYPTQTASQYPANIDADISVMARLAASYNPCAEDTPSALKVVVQTGAMFINGALVANAAQTVTLATAHATLPRIDRVVIDAITGVASKIDGTAAASPVAPAITSGKLPVAQVAVAAAATIISNSNITDERAGIGGGLLSTPSFYDDSVSDSPITITGAEESMAYIDLGNVVAGEIYSVSWRHRMSKGATAGLSGTYIIRDSGSSTASINLPMGFSGSGRIDQYYHGAASVVTVSSGHELMLITAPGTLVLDLRGVSLGSNGTVTSNDAQISATKIR